MNGIQALRDDWDQHWAEFSEADFTANREWVKQELKREMYVTGFSVDESRRVAIEQLHQLRLDRE